MKKKISKRRFIKKSLNSRKKNPFEFNDENVRRWLYLNLPKHFPNGNLEGDIENFLNDFINCFSYESGRWFLHEKYQKNLEKYYKAFEKIYSRKNTSKNEKDKLWRNYMIEKEW